MIEKFPMKFVDGHIIVTMNKFDYLIDTGSPSSFGNGSPILITGQCFTFDSTCPIGISIDSLNSLSGLQINGLIGMDILCHFDLKFIENQMIFSDKILENELTSIKLPIIETLVGIPIIHLNIQGKNQRIFFDTGAKISYLSDDLLVGKSIGRLDDFHPSIGKYQTEIYKIDVKIDEQIHNLTFGSLPTSLKSLLTIGRTKGVIGTQLFQMYSITISNLNKCLLLQPI